MRDKFTENQKNRLLTGQISRREFIQSMIAAGVALPVALSLAGNALAATPNKGGRLRQGFGHGSTTDSLDPATTENGMTTSVSFTYANCLTEIDSDGSLIPELAESFDSPDAKTWTFKLRNGVEFHNGKSMTADDVIASINHHRGEDSKSAAKGLVSAIKEIRKDDDHTVVFELENANAGFPVIVSDYHLLILPAGADGKIDPVAGIGTGPYKLGKFEPGVRAIFARNPNYWKEGRGHFDEIETLSLLDTAARQNAVMNGDVDVINRVDPKTVALLARVPTLNILEVTGTLHYTFPMRLDVPPFDNFDLRMAVKYAVKRQEMVDKILLGHGVIGNDHPISVANQFHNAELPQREYDPDKARHHLKNSGLEGTVLQLSAADAAFPGAVDAAQLIKSSAEAAGLKIDVVREPKDGYWSNVWNKKGWCASYWNGRPTEDWMFSSAYVADTEWNETAWRTTDAAKKFNELVLQARAELDQTKRRELYHECQRIVHEDGGALVPMFANHIQALSKKLAHPEKVAGNWEMDGNKSTERWWFA